MIALHLRPVGGPDVFLRSALLQPEYLERLTARHCTCCSWRAAALPAPVRARLRAKSEGDADQSHAEADDRHPQNRQPAQRHRLRAGR